MPPNPNLPAFEKFGRTINPSQDPTKTQGLRARWVAHVRKRWSEVQVFVRQSVVSEDFFGLKRDTPPGNPSQQIERFMAALVRVEKQTINEEKGGFIPWITPFVGEGFGKGMIRGNRDLAALARGQRRETATNAVRLVTNAELFEAPTLDPNNLQDALQAGERARLFEMEVTRTWQGITGVTAQVNAQVAQAIATALETRATPRQLAKDINERIDKVGKTRSEMIARTETVAANNRGAVAEFAEAQRLTGFEVHVQWETSLDSRVRDTHIVRHGDVYTKEAGLGLISEPNCRCALLPYIPAIEGDVDLSSGKAAKALTPDEAKARAERERKKLGLPKGQVGTPIKRRKVKDGPEVKPAPKPKPKPKAALKPKTKKKPVIKPVPDSLTKEQQTVIGAFDDAPDDLKAAVARSKVPNVELLDASEGSSYNKKTNILKTVRGNETVARHEYGHSLLNNNSDHVGVRSKMSRAINDDLGLLGRSLDIDDRVSIGVLDSGKLAEIGVKNPFKVSRALDAELKERFPFGLDDNGALHDLFGSATKNKIGRGHATSYYSGTSGRSLLRMTDEAYANMTTLYASNGPQWDFARKHFPSLTDTFLESLI